MSVGEPPGSDGADFGSVILCPCLLKLNYLKSSRRMQTAGFAGNLAPSRRQVVAVKTS